MEPSRDMISSLQQKNDQQLPSILSQESPTVQIMAHRPIPYWFAEVEVECLLKVPQGYLLVVT